MEKMNKYRVALIWGAAMLFSALQFFLQISNNMMVTYWQQNFHLTHEGAGLLCSIFFWAYFFIQIPAGLLIDHFGLKRVLSIAVFLLSASCVLFVTTKIFLLVVLARFLMGLAAGFGFVGMLLASIQYFDEKYTALMIGLGEFLSMVISALGQHISPYFVQTDGWKSIYIVLAIILLINAVVIVLLFPTHQCSHNRFEDFFQSMIASLKKAIATPLVWQAGIFCAGTFAVLTIFTDIWATVFLQQVDQFSYLKAAHTVVWIINGIAIGALGFGWLARYLEKIKYLMIIAAILAFITALLIIFKVTTNLVLLKVLLCLLGIGCSGQLLSFSSISKHVDQQISGVANVLCNMQALLVAVLFQPFIGYLLNVLHQTQLSQIMVYQYSMLVFPLIILMSVIVAFFIKV